MEASPAWRYDTDCAEGSGLVSHQTVSRGARGPARQYHAWGAHVPILSMEGGFGFQFGLAPANPEDVSLCQYLGRRNESLAPNLDQPFGQASIRRQAVVTGLLSESRNGGEPACGLFYDGGDGMPCPTELCR